MLGTCHALSLPLPPPALSAFRNYTAAALDLDGRHLVLTGPNGAGKTNLLEAVSLLSPGRGLRRATFETLGNQASDQPWAVAATIETPDGAGRYRHRRRRAMAGGACASTAPMPAPSSR